MFIPQTFSVALAMMVFCMFCWGSFANAFKMAGNVRFELLYWDYVLGVFLTAIIIGVTLGTWHGGETSLFQNLAQARGPSITYALAAGTVFNLANILLVIAVSIAGMSVAFPLSIGTALVVGTILTYLVDSKGNPSTLSLGVLLAAIAVVCSAIAYKQLASGEGASKRGTFVAIVAGLLMGTWAPLSAASMNAASGALTPYTSLIFFCFATLVSTVFFNTYFMKKPLHGEPVSFTEYFKGKPTWHAWGFVAGMVWTFGTASNLIAGRVTGFAVSYALGQSGPMVATLWGVFVWHEFKNSNSKAKAFLTLMFVFYLAAISLIALS